MGGDEGAWLIGNLDLRILNRPFKYADGRALGSIHLLSLPNLAHVRRRTRGPYFQTLLWYGLIPYLHIN